MSDGMRFKIRKGMIKAGALILLIVGCTLICLSFIRKWEMDDSVLPLEYSQPGAEETQGQTYYDGNWYVPRDNLETILFLGLDEFSSGNTEESYNNSRQADFILLLVVDHESNAVSAIHLNRDTMANIQILGVTGEPAGTFTGQLALAHTFGDGARTSCLNAARAVSNLLYGVKIDHYLSLTMDAVPALNDMVGGVPVVVLDDFTTIDPELVSGSTVLLQGEQALTYVRARRDLEDGSNLHRMERQRQYINGFLEQLQASMEDNPEFFIDTIVSIADCLVSDCTIEQLSRLAGDIQAYRFDGIYTLEGETIQGEEYIEFYADDEAIQTLVMGLFYRMLRE